MGAHLETGRNGEQLATDWLQAAGFRVLERNWRYGRREIDIIACKSGVLHFIEVKTSRGETFGMPELRVTRSKFRSLCCAAEAYLEEQPQCKQVQFDIVAIIIRFGGTDIQLLEDIS